MSAKSEYKKAARLIRTAEAGKVDAGTLPGYAALACRAKAERAATFDALTLPVRLQWWARFGELHPCRQTAGANQQKGLV